MIPFNSLSSQSVRALFQSPADQVKQTLLEDVELGGVAIQNPSQGHRVHNWYGYVDTATSNIYLRIQPGVIDIFIANQPNVFEFSFAFDQSMRWLTVCTLVSGTTLLRWHDPTVNAYVTSTFTGINSARLTLDDSRERQIQLGASDVILTYFKTSTGNLCFRAQRDRYLIEYVLSTGLPSNLVLTNFGMSRINRLQWRARFRTFSEVLPWLP